MYEVRGLNLRRCCCDKVCDANEHYGRYLTPVTCGANAMQLDFDTGSSDL
jgi:hypothetical protein